MPSVRLGCSLALLACALALAPVALGEGSPAQSSDTLDLRVMLPPHATDEEDAYLCTAVKLPDRPLKLVGVEPTSDQRIVHHMLLFGCQTPAQDAEVWPCRMMRACGTASESVLYGWGKNAPATAMPAGAGFAVGPGTGIRTLVLQMHYLHGRPANDTSGLRLRLSGAAVPYSAGMVAFASSFRIPPRTPSTCVPNACCYEGWEPLHGFAARVHTHALGREVRLDAAGRPSARAALEQVLSLDPQKPQGFYPVEPQHTFYPGDTLVMSCLFNSTAMDLEVLAGHSASDEMCNLYLMLYSHLPYFAWCLDNNNVAELYGPGGLPAKGSLVAETRVWQPPAVIKRVGAAAFKVGQVSGVASRPDGTVWVFHRGARAWNPDGSVANAGSTSSGAGMEAEGLLQGPVVLQLDQDSGAVLRSWGNGAFVMPHMITPDHEGNLWLTDVALHQALKYSPEGKQLMALGTRLQPGSGPASFCKPTQVAVGRDGTLYVSDGYCNSRVAQFHATGTWVRDFTVPTGKGQPMLVPHSVVIHECRQQLIVAERERGRVHAFALGSGDYLGMWDLQQQFGMPFALTLGPYGSVLALVWQHQVSPPRSYLVALGDTPSAISSSWPLEGLQYPHDLTLLPAPLELTGAGERLLAVLVAETKDQGQNLHKFVCMPQGTVLGGNASAAEAPAAGAGSAEAADEQLTAAELEDKAAVAAAKAGVAAHFGGSTHAHGSGDDLEEAQPQPQEVVAAVGHKPVKPVEGGGGQAAAATEEAAEATVGHRPVTPVDDDSGSSGGSKEEQARKAQPAAAAAAAESGDSVDAEEWQAQPHSGGRGGGGDEAQTGHGMVRPAAGSVGEQQEGEEEAWEAMVAATAAEDGAAGKAEQQAAAAAAQQEQQQQEQQQQQPKQQAAAAQSKAAAAEAEEAAGEGWHPAHQQVLGRSIPAIQPVVLGVVFVSVALFSWTRLQHWRGRGGAGYQAPTPAGHAGDPRFGSQGHLASLEHRPAGSNAASPHDRV